MTRQAWSLPFTAGAARQARRFVAGVLHHRGVDADSVEVATLLVSEVVSNAVLHGEGPLRLSMTQVRDGWCIRVGDHSDDHPQLRPGRKEFEGGRGLLLVEMLALAWGTDSAPDGGKDVWFVVTTESDSRDERAAASA